MSRARALRLVFLLAVVAVISLPVFFAVRQARQAKSHTAILPDGTKVEYLGSVRGTGPFTTDKPWMRTARAYLPAVVTSKLPPVVTGSCGYDSNSLALYFRVTPGGNTPWRRFRSEDDAGFEYEQGGGYCSFAGQPGSTIYGLTLRAYPRRQKDFRFHLLGDNEKVLATFHLPNLHRGPFPQWKPLPLPQSKTNGPLVLTLKSMKFYDSKSHRYVNADWSFNSSDPAWRQPRRPYPEFSDATGNAGSVLSFREPAWKIRAVVHRERSEDFDASEKLTITNLAVPEPLTFYQVTNEGVCAGVVVGLEAVSAPGRLDLTNGTSFGFHPFEGTGSSTMSSTGLRVESWSHNQPFILIKSRSLLDRDDLQFEAVDDHGKHAILSWHSTQTAPDGTVRRPVELKLTPGAKRFDLEIRVSRPLGFEFVVNPAEVDIADKK